MPTPIQSSAASIGSVDAQRVEDALALVAPKWTTWTAQTLAQQGHPMRVREVAARLPFIGEQLVGKRLAQMQADGLVVRPGSRFGAPYQLSEFGESLPPVHRALSDWSQSTLSLGKVAGAERVEDAVRRLSRRHTTSVIQVLDTGPTRFVDLAEEAGLDTNATWYRLHQMQRDGLVVQTDSRFGAPYTLTDAGRALGPVYEAVSHWSNPAVARRNSSAPVPVATAARSHTSVPLGAGGVRTAAALRRSAAAPSDLFSHAPQPQPRVPAAVTAQSAPGRGR